MPGNVAEPVHLASPPSDPTTQAVVERYGRIRLVRRGRVLRRPLRVDAARRGSTRTRRILDLGVATTMHHGGQLQFGPDGLLYVSTGMGDDPGPSQDPDGPAGKILRLDPRRRAARPHAAGARPRARPGWCSTVGGHVVRGGGPKPLRGRYLYGDVCSGDLWSARLDGARLLRPRRAGLRIPYLVSFGEDARGRIYAVSLNGAVWRLRG